MDPYGSSDEFGADLPDLPIPRPEDQAEAPLAFTPQGPGRACVGMRMNKVNPFSGAVRQAAFTRDVALLPDRFVLPIQRG